MTEPPAPPPPNLPPTVAPQYTVPTQATDRWLGKRGRNTGLVAGLALYVIGYLVTAVLSLRETDVALQQVNAFFVAVISGGIATLLVLLAAIVFIVNRRTRALGSGLAISLPIGVVLGIVTTVLLFASSG